MQYGCVMMMRALIAIALAAPAAPALMSGTAAAAELDLSHPASFVTIISEVKDCTCLNRGERVLLGDTTCIKVGEREFTAQCAMTLNNPTWHYVTEGCRPPDIISLLLD